MINRPMDTYSLTHTQTQTHTARTGGESKHVGGRSECYIVLCQISCQELHTPLNPYLGTGTFVCMFMSCVVAHLICVPNLREFQMQFKFPKTYCQCSVCLTKPCECICNHIAMSMRKTVYSSAHLILSSFDILLSSLSIVYLFLSFYPISHLLWFAIPFLLLHYLLSFSSLYSYPHYFVPLTSYLF